MLDPSFKFSFRPPFSFGSFKEEYCKTNVIFYELIALYQFNNILAGGGLILFLPIIAKQSGESKKTEAMFRLNQSSPEVELVQKMLVFLTISLLLTPLSECKLVKRSLASHPLAK